MQQDRDEEDRDKDQNRHTRIDVASKGTRSKQDRKDEESRWTRTGIPPTETPGRKRFGEVLERSREASPGNGKKRGIGEVAIHRASRNALPCVSRQRYHSSAPAVAA